ncbi:hypothetical protein ACFQI7_26200 [Paenibacillus allorhizosphaerae]|uniref:Uncharacterized protein n=1 Tax=Paenibacillus allorhizosphaerae TaxID=2849866 RepID=A0ABM8VJQ4_9BACL|nr:hypothetical protein [Paenibacillus allorhizosphaerae]CAG7645842.1 hypothetical protein PAECIP111802_03617 [Paenibacillus allorhizosphaerae]
MNRVQVFFEHYGLSVILVIGALLAIFFVYKNWDKIVIKGSGRK